MAGTFFGQLDDEQMMKLANNTVNHPSHYTQGDIECIDAIKASMDQREYLGYLKGNVVKYIWRYDKKGADVEDLEKATWYLERLQDEVAKMVKELHEEVKNDLNSMS